MPTVTFDVKDLPARFAEMVSLVESGTDVTLHGEGASSELRIPGRACEDIAPEAKPHRRKLGRFEGQIWMAEDFDAPLPEAFWLGDS